MVIFKIRDNKTQKENMIKTNKTPLESEEQELIFKWRDENKFKWPELFLLHSSGNGLRLTPGQATKAKKQGLTKGIPDIMLPVPKNNYHGLFIELKRIKGGKVSPEQELFLKALEKQGYKAVVCHGHKEAIETIKQYLGID